MSIEQIETRTEIPDLLGKDVIDRLIAESAAIKVAQQRKDQLFNLSGQATGLNKLPTDARQGLCSLVMRYNVANE